MFVVLAFIFIIGLVIGSFLNVVILRTVSNESIVLPASKCPKCQTPLKWYHNIPILSYIFLKGKCAFCHNRISIQYPIVELLTGLIFVIFGYFYLNAIFNTQESVPILLVMLAFSVVCACLFIVISGTDIIEMQVSDMHTYSLIGLGILYSIIIGGFGFYSDFKFGFVKLNLFFTPILYTLAAVIIAFVIMELLRRCSNFIVKKEAFGDGDSYIFAGICGIVTAMFGANDFLYLCLTVFILAFLSIILSVIISLPLYLKNIIANKNWSLLSILSAFVICASGYFYISGSDLFSNTFIYIAFTLLLLVLGIILCFKIIKSIQNKNQDNLMQIPFGPYLCLSGLISLFILPILLGII